ncbi:unnamed protein product, partial [Anisakis simplex]|uniref:Secreted protein n=1 Tax=Anisakis simplex TaxID=6269 RepID=A0A0M3JNY6_ANISI
STSCCSAGGDDVDNDGSVVGLDEVASFVVSFRLGISLGGEDGGLEEGPDNEELAEVCDSIVTSSIFCCLDLD